VSISIEDNGIGIPTGMNEAIFEMFTQLDDSQDQGKRGLGVGLSLTKSLVEMHGGGIEVNSGGPGQGTTFTVRMPILGNGAPPVAAKEQGDPHGEESGGALRVLVVDDNEAALEILEMLVTMLGNEVRTASDGRRAIEVAGDFRPHLVLMDLGMPGMTGYEAARLIRAQPWGTKMKLVALSGWGQPEHKRRTKEAGFDLHLVKPPKLDDLKRLLAEAPDQP
jgi:CheY-like chemotaxis protein